MAARGVVDLEKGQTVSKAIEEVLGDVTRLEVRADAHDRRLDQVEDRMERISETVDKIWGFRVWIIVGMAFLGGGEEALGLLKQIWK